MLFGDQQSVGMVVRGDEHLAELVDELHHIHGDVEHDDCRQDVENNPLKLLFHPLAHNPMNLKGSAAAKAAEVSPE